MAHSCPECGQACHCGGDIDEIVMSGTAEEMNCEHCGYLLDEDDEDDDIDEDDDEDTDDDEEEDDEVEYGYEVED